MQPAKKQSSVLVERGDILTIRAGYDGSLKFEIRVVGITCYGELCTPERENYLFGTIVGEPDAILRVDFRQAVVDYNGADSFNQHKLYDAHCDGYEVEFKNSGKTLAPFKVSTKTVQEFVPCKVGDILKKRSSTYSVVYVNDKGSTVIVERTATDKIEQIHERDLSSVKAFDLISK